MRELRAVCVVGLLVLGCALQMYAQERTVPLARQPDFAAIDAYLESEMRSERIPGMSVAIVHERAIVHARGFGWDGAERRVTPGTPMIIGSMSKAFTALAIMQLVEAGQVDLDQAARFYLPEFRVADSAASAAITVRQLLHHTSGIPTKAPRGSEDGRGLPAQVAVLSQVTLTNRPGVRHEYASPNYIVLGAIVERVSGMPFGEYLRTRVFTPLKMTGSYLSQDSALHHGMSRGHRYWFGFPVATTLPYEADRLPTASIIASAEDLGHFMIAGLNAGVYDGSAVLSGNGVAVMHRPGVDAGGFSYAMGWRVSQDSNGRTLIHHGGIVPHFRGKMVMRPESKWGVVVLTNVSSALPLSPASHRAADHVAAYLGGAPLPAPGARFKIVHLLIAIAVLAVTVHQVRATVAVLGVRREGGERSRTSARLAVGLLVPVAVVVGIPLVIGISWMAILQSTPDLTWWLLAVMLVEVATILYAMARAPRSAALRGDL